MRNQRKIERKRQQFQIAATLFFAVTMIAVLVMGLCINTSANLQTDKPATSTTENTILVSVTPEDTEEPDKRYFNIPLSAGLQDYIFTVTEQYNVPAEVVIAIIERESSYRPNATGLEGEQGLMQIHPINHEWLSEELGITDYYDPEQNILAGTYLLSGLFNKYDTAAEALMCYNCGEAGAQRLWAKGVTETDYTVGILSFIETLEYKEARKS